jgi:nitrite reductase (NADH) large subunit
MHSIENFFFTAIQTANILKVTCSLSRLDGSSSKQRSPFASEDALTGLSAFTSLQKQGRIEWHPVSSMNEARFEHLVFAGNGMSGMACVEELIKSGPVFDITIFGDEPYGNYDRTLLPSVLAGERDIDSIVLNDIEWYQEHGIRTRLAIRVEEIDRLNRAVRSSDGDWTGYDKLILATGSSPEIPEIKGLDKSGVFVFGTLDDTRKLADAAGPGVRAVVIGGWLAAEAARGLRSRGCEVVVIESGDSSDLQIEAVIGPERAEAVRFTSGEEFGADLVVIATNPMPNTALARSAGLQVHRGIVVNDQMETSDPHIFAVGGCTEHKGRTFDSFAPLREQAKVLAGNLAGAFQELTASPRHHRAE